MTFEDAKDYLEQVLREKNKRDGPKPVKKAVKEAVVRPPPPRERFGKVTTREKAVEAITRIVKNTPNGEITFADFGTRFQDLTGASWSDSARMNLGSLRPFVLSRPEFVVTDTGRIALATSSSARPAVAAASATAAAPATAAAAPQRGSAPRGKTAAHGHSHSHGPGNKCSHAHGGFSPDADEHDEEEMRRNTRGCTPGGSQTSGLSSAMAGASALVFTLVALAVILHLDIVPGAGQHPTLAPIKRSIDGFIAELLR